MSGDDYLAGYGGERIPQRRVVRPVGWQPGQRRREVLVPCCDACGSVEISCRNNGRRAMLDRFECSACGNTWHESPGPLQRGYIIPPN